MEITGTQPGTQPLKRYYISGTVLRPRLYTIVGILTGVPLFLKIMGEDVDGLVFVMFAVMIVLCLLVVWWATRVSWMSMDANGLRYKGIGFQVATSWDNVAEIGSRFIMNEGNVEGLVLHDSGLDANGVLRAGSMLNWGLTVALRDLENFIPLSNFQTKEWRDTPFGQEMRRYVPRLFE